MSDFGGAVKKSSNYDLAVIGVPFDEKSSYLRGAAKGPAAIREASTEAMINPCTELGVDLALDTVLVDLGDINIKGGFFRLASRLEEKITEIIKAKAVPFVLGGDHSISYPVVKAFAEKIKPLDILHFDAHPDMYDEFKGDPYSHACPFARILEEGLAQHIVQVGIRAANSAQREKAEKFGVQWIEMKDLPKKSSLEFSNPLYISFDIDALDPAFAPGVSHCEPGGLSTRQVINMIHKLNAEIVGMDVVEVNPDKDVSGITASAAVKIAMEVMGKVVLSMQVK